MTKINNVKDEFKIGKNKIGYVSSSFLEEFGNDEIKKGTSLSFQKLSRDMNDSEIIKELGVAGCTLGDVLATLENANDEMRDGWPNLFYVAGHPSRVVDVYWSADGGEWGVGAWIRDHFTWHGGGRVFSPATSGTLASSPSSLSSDTLDLESAMKLVKNAGYKIMKEL